MVSYTAGRDVQLQLVVMQVRASFVRFAIDSSA